MIGLVAPAIFIARLIFPAPSNTSYKNTTALPPAEHGALAEALTHRSERQKGPTGIAPLQNGQDAFAARILLANAAVSSIDVQYYI